MDAVVCVCGGFHPGVFFFGVGLRLRLCLFLLLLWFVSVSADHRLCLPMVVILVVDGRHQCLREESIWASSSSAWIHNDTAAFVLTDPVKKRRLLLRRPPRPAAHDRGGGGCFACLVSSRLFYWILSCTHCFCMRTIGNGDWWPNTHF